MESEMKKIYDGLKRAHPPRFENDPFQQAVYGLYNEFRMGYMDEWKRLEDNERMYHGDHWFDVKTKDPKEPKPTTPILFSTIENIRADMQDEFPEVVIEPEGPQYEIEAKILQKVVEQVLDETDYAMEFQKCTHDLLVGGYFVQEVGWDQEAHFGVGSGHIWHLDSKNVLFDPMCSDIQNGRAVFKVDKLPRSWFEQHYPKLYPYMKGGETYLDSSHFESNSKVKDAREEEGIVLLEAWFRVYDPEERRYAVHMVQLAGGQVLENSYLAMEGKSYFRHGLYPFVVTPLYRIKGSPLGLGVVDMFKTAQQYSDKLAQILVKNAFTAGHTRMLIQSGAGDPEELADYNNEVVEMDNIAGVQFLQDKPLPSYIMNFMQLMQNSIKDESGSNEFSRGNVSSGVTAASAITSLQDMSTKRSRMEATTIHQGFKQAVRMLLETIAQFEVTGRKVSITYQGQAVTLDIQSLFYKIVEENGHIPVEYLVRIRPVRETKYSKLSNNELVLQIMTLYQGQPLDPSIMIEAMEFNGKELVLEKLRRAQAENVMALQQQLLQAQEQNVALQEENAALNEAMSSAQAALLGSSAELGTGTPMPVM